MRIDRNARVTLLPGIYVIKDGSLTVESFASVQGRYVGFYFTGRNVGMKLEEEATIDISGPKDGPMAGILISEDRSNAPANYRIRSNRANNMVGTIYLPRGRFWVDSERPVADRSAWTAIVARSIIMSAGPNLVLNTNYWMTDVPVPVGVGPSGTRLIR